MRPKGWDPHLEANGLPDFGLLDGASLERDGASRGGVLIREELAAEQVSNCETEAWRTDGTL